MNLLDLPKGKSAKVIDYRGGRNVDFKLRQLGISPGRIVKVLRYAPLGGPLMLDVEGRSVALGRGIAARVQVEVSQ
jgi:Fe2+ transport system protein FeoA